jgi:hypothetical protein
MGKQLSTWVGRCSLLLIPLLAGCASDVMISRAAGANDSALDGAVFMVCNGASVGSVRRRFGTEEQAQIWRELCEQHQGWKP